MVPARALTAATLAGTACAAWLVACVATWRFDDVRVLAAMEHVWHANVHALPLLLAAVPATAAWRDTGRKAGSRSLAASVRVAVACGCSLVAYAWCAGVIERLPHELWARYVKFGTGRVSLGVDAIAMSGIVMLLATAASVRVLRVDGSDGASARFARVAITLAAMGWAIVLATSPFIDWRP